jgi:acetyl esterase/lipase
MPETLEMAANAQAAGAPVSARVYAGMWHCFQEYSQGCGNSAKEPLAAGLDAMRVGPARTPAPRHRHWHRQCRYGWWLCSHTERIHRAGRQRVLAVADKPHAIERGRGW